MPQALTRRRFIAVAAAAAGASLLPGRAEPALRWRGTALGAEASLTLAGIDRNRAVAAARRVEREIARLESVFSLYRSDSALVRLNRDGRLAAPPPELLAVLTLCDAIHDATGGAFDPTVQPLWRLRAAAGAAGRSPTKDEMRAALGHTGWEGVEVRTDAVRLVRPGMAITLNGIAQGAITDRIAALLRRDGFDAVLIDVGEIAALGETGSGRPWRAGIAAPGGAVVRQIVLKDRALATSAPLGTVLDARRGVGHILDPQSGAAAGRWSLVSVSAPSAAVADGLSTAFCLMQHGAIADALTRFPDARLEELR